jgi:hypothetical protein
VAGARAGLIAFSCNKCKSADVKDEKSNIVSNYIKESLGCEKALDNPGTWFNTGDDDGELFFNCPLKFISPSVKMFFEKYDLYCRKMIMPLNYENESSKFLEGIEFFESWLDQYSKMIKGE